MSKRKAIPLKTKLAAALACLLPQSQRDELRANRVSPEMVISLFRHDHITPHADGGSDEWWNIDPLQTAVHEEKTAKIDVPRIAKGKRLRAKLARHNAIMANISESQEARQASNMPPDMQKRPIRGFPNRPKRGSSQRWPKGRKIPTRPLRRQLAKPI